MERLWIQGLSAFNASKEVKDAKKSNIERSLPPESIFYCYEFSVAQVTLANRQSHQFFPKLIYENTIINSSLPAAYCCHQ
jgi:hypothetical protein